MSKVGEPFKMKPLTRNARNALNKACDYMQTCREDIQWKAIRAETGRRLVVALGDNEWETARWVQTQNDPDLEIVHPRESQKELVKERIRGKRERGTLPEWPDDLDAGRL